MAAKKARKEPEEVSREPIVTEWCGAPRYACPVCGRDSDSESTIRDHIDGHFPNWLGVTEEADVTAATDQNGVHGAVSNSGVGPDDDGGGRQ